MNNTLRIHTDGGSRGNPGPSACAAVFLEEGSDSPIFQKGKFLGTGTNNEAEYEGVILALDEISSDPSGYTPYSQIDFYLDSELVVKQLTGVYKIKQPHLQLLAQKIHQLMNNLPDKKFGFTHVRRHLNHLPDTLLNQTLDSNS